MRYMLCTRLQKDARINSASCAVEEGIGQVDEQQGSVAASLQRNNKRFRGLIRSRGVGVDPKH